MTVQLKKLLLLKMRRKGPKTELKNDGNPFATAEDEKKRSETELKNDGDPLATTCSEPVADNGAKEPIPQVVTIHATAIYNDSPNETLTNDEVDSLVRFLTNIEHLSRNILNIEYSYQ